MDTSHGPTRAHLWLAGSAGTWSMTGHYYFAPDDDVGECTNVGMGEHHGTPRGESTVF